MVRRRRSPVRARRPWRVIEPNNADDPLYCRVREDASGMWRITRCFNEFGPTDHFTVFWLGSPIRTAIFPSLRDAKRAAETDSL